MKKEFINSTSLNKVLKRINEGGITYDLFLKKDYGNTNNVAVSPFPERSYVFKGKATKKMIKDFCDKNDVLLRNNFALGAWFDKESNQTYLDITAVIPTKKIKKAINLGKKANQIAGFNLMSFKEFSIGGTGTFNQKVSPFKDRLIEALTLI